MKHIIFIVIGFHSFFFGLYVLFFYKSLPDPWMAVPVILVGITGFAMIVIGVQKNEN